MLEMRFTKDELLEALEARRPAVQREDKRRLAAHRKDEQRALKTLHDAARKALSLKTYDAAKAFYDRDGEGWSQRAIYFHPPSCPMSLESRLDSTIKFIKATGQTTFFVSARGKWGDIWSLLQDGPTEKALC